MKQFDVSFEQLLVSSRQKSCCSRLKTPTVKEVEEADIVPIRPTTRRRRVLKDCELTGYEGMPATGVFGCRSSPGFTQRLIASMRVR